jgi:hypothetical protein
MKRFAISFDKKIFLTLLAFLLFCGTSSFGQEDKKSVSLTLQHLKIMKENSFLTVEAKSKGKNGFEPCKNVIFTIYKTDTTGAVADIKIGAVKTNKVGKAKFSIPSKFLGASESYKVKLENDKIYDDTDESVSVTNATINASIEKTDSIYTLKAQVLDAANKPLAEETLKVGLQRLFGNLAVGGEDSFTTDADGLISVPIEKGYTGVDGKLNFQVVIEESDKFGTVIANVPATFGKPIVDQSTFNERTMWAPPTKTPLFLLIIPNVILVGIWSILVLLVFNLFKIYKSKN